MAIKKYKIDTRKVKSLDDICKIFNQMELTFTPATQADYEELKHLLIHPGIKIEAYGQEIQTSTSERSES